MHQAAPITLTPAAFISDQHEPDRYLGLTQNYLFFFFRQRAQLPLFQSRHRLRNSEGKRCGISFAEGGKIFLVPGKVRIGDHRLDLCLRLEKMVPLSSCSVFWGVLLRRKFQSHLQNVPAAVFGIYDQRKRRGLALIFCNRRRRFVR
jgi:hypothetical protein